MLANKQLPLNAALLAALTLGAWTPPARASCAAHTAKQYVDEAQLVFLGRAGPLKVRGKRSYQPFQVLHALKGKRKLELLHASGWERKSR